MALGKLIDRRYTEEVRKELARLAHPLDIGMATEIEPWLLPILHNEVQLV
jgi:hypothetical protein